MSEPPALAGGKHVYFNARQTIKNWPLIASLPPAYAGGSDMHGLSQGFIRFMSVAFGNRSHRFGTILFSKISTSDCPTKWGRMGQPKCCSNGI